MNTVPAFRTDEAENAFLAEIAARNGEIARLGSEITRLNAEAETLRPLKAKVQELEAQVEALKTRVCQLERSLYGRKSEREKGEAAEAGEPELPAGRRRGQQPGTRGHGRRRQLNLPTEEVIHDLPEGQRRCPSCGLAYEPTSLEDTSEEIDFRVTVKRVVHRRPLYRRTCSCSDQPGLVSAPAPGKVYPHCPYTPQTIAWFVLLKHTGILPLNRIRHLLRLQGLFLARGSMVGMLRQVAILLAPLYEAFRARCRAADRWHADETGWKIFMPPPGKDSFRWWLWVFAAADVVVFHLNPSRGAKVLKEFFGLEGPNPSRGILSCDMFSSYKAVRKFLVAAYCWAHMRRYFRDAGKNHPEQLAEWSRAWRLRIVSMYRLNKARLAFSPGSPAFLEADEALRRFVAQEVEAVWQAELADAKVYLPAREVLQTMKHHWEGLTLFLGHPELPMDNNLAERLLRTPVVGRKNFYGHQAAWSGELSALIWSIQNTCELHRLDPLRYLTEYLTACAAKGGKPLEGPELDRFLPWSMSEEQRQAWAAPGARDTS